MLRPSVFSGSGAMITAASSRSSRSARILVAMPSPDSSNCLNVLKPRTIRSRMMSSDQRSPNISSETLTGQPERGCDFDAIEQKRDTSKSNLQNASHLLKRRALVRPTAAEGLDQILIAQPVARALLHDLVQRQPAATRK